MTTSNNDNNEHVNVIATNKNEELPKEESGNRNLYVKGLWKDCTQVELDDLFKQYGSIVQSRVYGNGVGFVRFQEGKQAHAAIIGLNGTKPNTKFLQTLIVKYANKKIRQPKENETGSPLEMFVCENTKNIYVRFLPSEYNESELYQLCSKFGQITCIRLCKKGFAFVRFLSGHSAFLCINELNGKLLPGASKPLMVKFANSDPFEPRIGFRSSCVPYIQQRGGMNFHMGLQNNHSNPFSYGGQETNNYNCANVNMGRNDVSSNSASSSFVPEPNRNDTNNSNNCNEWNSPLTLGNSNSNTSNISDISSVNSSSSSSVWSLNSPCPYYSFPLNAYNPQSIPLYSNMTNCSQASLIQQSSSMIPISGSNFFSIPATSGISLPNNGIGIPLQPVFNTTTANFVLPQSYPETLENRIIPSVLNNNVASIQIPLSSLSIRDN